MARFSFGKRTSEEDEIPPEPVEGEVDAGMSPPEASGGEESGGREKHVSRPLILAGIGVLLIGSLYLANRLFLSPSVVPPTQPAAPVPSAPEAKAPVAGKEAAPAPSAPAAPIPPAAKAAPTPSAPAPTKIAPPAKTAPESTPPVKTTPPEKSAAPQAQATPSKTVTPAPKAQAKAPAKAAPAAGGYSIQVGAMAMEQNAESLKRKLDALGFPAVIRKGSGFVNNHIVTAGDPTGKREAEEMARRLNVDGFPSQIVSLEGKYAPQIGSFVSLDEAIDLARELQKKNYHPKITSKPVTSSLYQVRTGQFDTRAAAIKRGEELKAKGFGAWVVPN